MQQLIDQRARLRKTTTTNRGDLDGELATLVSTRSGDDGVKQMLLQALSRIKKSSAPDDDDDSNDAADNEDQEFSD